MFRIVFFLLFIPILNATDEQNKIYECSYDTVRYKRQTSLKAESKGAVIGKAVKSASKVLTEFSKFTGNLDDATKALRSFKPTEKVIETYVPVVKKLGTAIGAVADVVTFVAPIPMSTTPFPIERNEEGLIDPIVFKPPIERNKIQQNKAVTSMYKAEIQNMADTYLDSDKEFTRLSTATAKVMTEKTSEQAQKFEEVAQLQQMEYNVSLKQLELTQSMSVTSLKQFENITEQQNKQYDLSLKQAKVIADLDDDNVKQFLNLSEQQSKQYDLSLKQLKKVERVAEDQRKHVNKLSNQFAEGSQIQINKIKDVSNQISTLAQTQDQRFQEFSNNQRQFFTDTFLKVSAYSIQQVKNFEKYGQKQQEIFAEVKVHFDELSSYSKQALEQLNTLTELVSVGFKDLQEHMDKRFDRLEEMIQNIEHTVFFLSYESDVQRRLRELHDSYMAFVASIVNITDEQNNHAETSLSYLVKHCCKNGPFEIMATIYQKTVAKTMHLTNLLQMIYDSYFESNTERMMKLFEVILADVFKTTQLMAICDKVTYGRGIGFDEAYKQSKEIMAALDAITGDMEKRAFRILVDQNYVMKGIVDNWRILNETLPDLDAVPRDKTDLGCHVDESDFYFTTYAADELEKKFFFFTFYVVVFRYNEQRSALTNQYTGIKQANWRKPYRCNKNNMNYFTYKLGHTQNKLKFIPYHTYENIMIFTSILPKRMKIDPFCLDKIHLDCSQWRRGKKDLIRNATIFEARHHHYVCGSSWSVIPNVIKACFEGKPGRLRERALYLAACY